MSKNSNSQLDKNFKHEANLGDDDLKKFFDDLGLPDIAEVSLEDDHVVIPKTSKNL